MAIISVKTYYGLDVRTLGFSRLNDGYSYTESPTRFLVDYGNGYQEDFRGSGFTYSTLPVPTGGTVNSYAFIYAGHRLVSISGLNLAAVQIEHAAQTSSTSDDYAVIKL